MSKTYQQLYEENRNWLHELNFYHDEIKYFQNRLAKLAAKNTADIVKQVSHFKDHFLLQLEKIDNLRHKVFKYDKHLADKMELANRMNLEVDEDHHTLDKDMKAFEKNYQSLKKEFTEFLEKVL